MLQGFLLYAASSVYSNRKEMCFYKTQKGFLLLFSTDSFIFSLSTAVVVQYSSRCSNSTWLAPVPEETDVTNTLYVGPFKGGKWNSEESTFFDKTNSNLNTQFKTLHIFTSWHAGIIQRVSFQLWLECRAIEAISTATTSRDKNSLHYSRDKNFNIRSL